MATMRMPESTADIALNHIGKRYSLAVARSPLKDISRRVPNAGINGAPMKLSECLLFLVACVGPLLVVSPWPMAAQESTQTSTECVKRDPNLEPPRKTFPSRRAGKGGGQREYEEPRKLKPVCSSGEVPRVIVHPRLPHYPKGNPLLGPYTGPLESVSSEFIIRNLVLPFDQVYWKRDGRPTKKRLSPMGGTGDPPCDGIPLQYKGQTLCYYYGSAAEQRIADGGGMTYLIEQPALDNSGDNGEHSIGQIAVQGGPSNGDDVEMGWSVAPDQFGDSHPHLFVFHWINWDNNISCYANTGMPCVWNQYSSTYYPTMDLGSLVGKNVYIGWVHHNGAWWGWFNDEWLGSIPDSEWSGAFTTTTLIQWYGEVESNNGVPPKIQMGNGEFPSNTSAANMSTLCDVDAQAWICWYRDQQNAGATKINYYDIVNHTSFGAVRYGGPGQ
jgi:hypothetical protein